MWKTCLQFFWHNRHRALGICDTWASCRVDILLRCFKAASGTFPLEKACPAKRVQLCNAPWQQHTIAQFVRYPVNFDQKFDDCGPSSTVLTEFSTLRFRSVTKIQLKRHRLNITEPVHTKLQSVLDTFTEADFHKIFKECKKRWNRRIRAGWDYFEGDNSQDHQSGNFWITPRISGRSWNYSKSTNLGNSHCFFFWERDLLGPSEYPNSSPF